MIIITEFDLASLYEFKASFVSDSVVIEADNAQTIVQCVD